MIETTSDPHLTHDPLGPAVLRLRGAECSDLLAGVRAGKEWPVGSPHAATEAYVPLTSPAGPAAGPEGLRLPRRGTATALDADQVQRCKDLVIPPAWKDVWITPHPNGHLQAVGTDDAGRRQYLDHPQRRASRDAAKFDRILGFGKALSMGANGC